MANNPSPPVHWFWRICVPLVIISIAAFISVPKIISSSKELVKDNIPKKILEENFRSERDIDEENYRAGRAAFIAHEYDKAASLFRKGAEAGDAKSQGYLGVAYMMLNDHYNGIVWIRRAAEKGHVQSQYNLGLCYNWDFGTAGNADEAFYWLKKAEDNGLENAITRGMFSKQFCVE